MNAVPLTEAQSKHLFRLQRQMEDLQAKITGILEFAIITAGAEPTGNWRLSDDKTVITREG